MPAWTFVFGYGSLAIVPQLVPGRAFAPNGFVADLAGFERSWGVAMDNRHDLPGYKYYTDDRGRRPEVYVTYLDIRERAGRECQRGLHPGRRWPTRRARCP